MMLISHKSLRQPTGQEHHVKTLSLLEWSNSKKFQPKMKRCTLVFMILPALLTELNSAFSLKNFSKKESRRSAGDLSKIGIITWSARWYWALIYPGSLQFQEVSTRDPTLFNLVLDSLLSTLKKPRPQCQWLLSRSLRSCWRHPYLCH